MFINVSELKASSNMQENIRTLYAVTYPSSQNFEEIYKNTHHRSEHYNTSPMNNTKSNSIPVQNLERAFFSPNFKENTRQYFQRSHVKQECISTEYEGKNIYFINSYIEYPTICCLLRI